MYSNGGFICEGIPLIWRFSGDGSRQYIANITYNCYRGYSCLNLVLYVAPNALIGSYTSIWIGKVIVNSSGFVQTSPYVDYTYQPGSLGGFNDGLGGLWLTYTNGNFVAGQIAYYKIYS